MAHRPTRLNTRLPDAALAAVAALIAGLWLWHAGATMVFDEMASVWFSGQPWGHLWGAWMVRETNPPLFYSLLKLWRSLLPIGHWTLRALPLGIAAAGLWLFAANLHRRLGPWPAVLALALCAVSWSDIWQAAYLRGYGLARMAVWVSFVGLVLALEQPARRRGWMVYGAGALVAIHCHTTMLLWPVIATMAVVAEMALRRAPDWRTIARLIAADIMIAVLSAWVLVMAVVQLRGARAANISWLQPLGWGDFWATCNLQLLVGGTFGSALMAALMLAGLWRGRADRMMRLGALIALLAVAVFKATDALHPIISDYTLHWAFPFGVAVAAAALGGPVRSWHGHAAALAIVAAVLGAGLTEMFTSEFRMYPQDLRGTVQTVAAHPGAALLASHEAEGVVLEQACLVEWGHLPCPFPLVVLTDPRPTDNWAFGGYTGRLVPPAGARAALGNARAVYAFSRYFYTPLQHLGLHPADWPEVFWDDGELIGPIPLHAFDPPAPGEPARVPDPDAEYTGEPDGGD